MQITYKLILFQYLGTCTGGRSPRAGEAYWGTSRSPDRGTAVVSPRARESGKSEHAFLQSLCGVPARGV